MARSMMPNSAGSQFFIMHKAAPQLDGEYAAFGKVIEARTVTPFANKSVYCLPVILVNFSATFALPLASVVTTDVA